MYVHQAGTKLIDDPCSGFIDEDTVFWLCSQTKLVPTIVTMQMIEQGKIGFDTPVDQILPDLANPVICTGRDDAGNFITAPAKEKITVGQLLNHSSGLDYPAGEMPPLYSHSYTEGEDSHFLEYTQGFSTRHPTEIRTRIKFCVWLLFGLRRLHS
ncbi:beta-lactamase/transpeptidase-like protein [Mycena vulgaris]|nr:beta-lactamase/transpeptidase-like protein [Mycena vulgaris]